MADEATAEILLEGHLVHAISARGELFVDLRAAETCGYVEYEALTKVSFTINGRLCEINVKRGEEPARSILESWKTSRL